MKFLKMFSCAVAMLCTSAPALASHSSNGTVNTILILGGKVFFQHTGTRSATPACHTITGRWVFNGATNEGQAMLSALMTAYATGKQVSVEGTNNCSEWGDTEGITYLVLH